MLHLLGRLLFWGTAKESLSLRTIKTNFCIDSQINLLTSNPPGSLLALGTSNGEIVIVPTDTNKLPTVLYDAEEDIPGSVYALAFLDDDRIASASNHHKIKIWSLSQGKCLHTFDNKDGGRVTSLLYLNNQLISGACDGHLYFWDVGTYEFIKRVADPELASIWSMAIIAPNKIAYGTINGSVYLMELNAGNPMLLGDNNIEDVGHIESLSIFSSQSKTYLVSGSRKGEVSIWDWQLAKLKNKFNAFSMSNETQLHSVVSSGANIFCLTTGNFKALNSHSLQDEDMRWGNRMNNMYFDNQPISTVHLTTKGMFYVPHNKEGQLVIYGFAMKSFLGANGAVVGFEQLLADSASKAVPSP